MNFKNEDRISHLPEEILSQILSSIPTKLAVRTSILSKKWRYKWTLVTNLDFDDDNPNHGLDRFSNFVDRVLRLRKTSQLKQFRLRSSRYEMQMASESKSNMSNWINQVVRLNVSEVDLHVTPFKLPASLFTCKTLTKLSLRGWGLEDYVGPSVTIKLPLLKTLHITVPGLVSANAFRLIRSCPILETLSVEIGLCLGLQDCNFNIPTLKRLTLKMISSMSLNKVILNVPNLEYLTVVGLLSSLFVIQDLSCLVEATVRLSDMKEDLFFLYTELLKGIRKAKSISWSSPTLDVLLTSRLPKFPNLERLQLKGCLHSGSLILFQHLESSSRLEYLSFQEPEESRWIEPGSVPNWMIRNLKTMEIRRCKGRDCDLGFIEYVLGNAVALKTLTVTCKSLSVNDETKLCARLLKFQRATKYCEIHFVGKWLLNMF